MSKGMHFFLNSGANIHSTYKTFCTWDELGITEEEWDAMPEDEQEELAKEIAFGQSDWGFYKDEQ